MLNRFRNNLLFNFTSDRVANITLKARKYKLMGSKQKLQDNDALYAHAAHWRTPPLLTLQRQHAAARLHFG
jgi:hypothetical protein